MAGLCVGFISSDFHPASGYHHRSGLYRDIIRKITCVVIKNISDIRKIDIITDILNI